MRFSRAAVLRIAMLAAAAIIIPACGKDDDDEATVIGILLAQGGTGTGGNGGNASDIYFYGEFYGDIATTTQPGSVDATPPSINGGTWLGTNPKTVSTSQTLVAPGAGNTPFNGDV